MTRTTSDNGIKQIAVREGEVLHVYKDSKGLPTVGVGHLVKPGEPYKLGQSITKAESRSLLKADLQEAEDAVNAAVKVPLSQNEFDALVSLTFNIGTTAFKRSTVARLLNQGVDHKTAADAILRFNKPPEIQRRRRTEWQQFNTPDTPVALASTTATDTAIEVQPANSAPPADTSAEASAGTTGVSGAIDKIDKVGDTLNAASTAVSKVTSSIGTRLLVGLKALLGTWIIGAAMFVKENWVLLLIGLAVLALAAFLWNESRKRNTVK